ARKGRNLVLWPEAPKTKTERRDRKIGRGREGGEGGKRFAGVDLPTARLRYHRQKGIVREKQRGRGEGERTEARGRSEEKGLPPLPSPVTTTGADHL
ncbi:hypothetical protein U1Q18_009675, partial [Sarracenia purpurea var. burkii]